jgi:hypothetical protein
LNGGNNSFNTSNTNFKGGITIEGRSLVYTMGGAVKQMTIEDLGTESRTSNGISIFSVGAA